MADITEVTHHTSSTKWSKINGKEIPHSKYGIGTVYDDKDYPGSKQCAGFSRFILKYLFDDGNYGTVIDSTDTNTEAKAKTFFSTMTKGSRIIGQSSSGSDIHSMIYLGKEGNYINVYHANWDYKNGVFFSKFPYSKFASTYAKARAQKA